MIGFWVVEKFTGDKDGAGYDTAAWCASKMNDNIKALLYLPPYLRKAQCNIDKDSVLLGIVDDVSGLGVAVYGEGSADFQYFFDADIEVKKTFTVDKSTSLKDTLSVSKTITAIQDIQSTTGDVIATTVNLKTHIHPITTISPIDAAAIMATATGTVTPLTAFYTITPT